jgi:hypothetical protein
MKALNPARRVWLQRKMAYATLLRRGGLFGAVAPAASQAQKLAQRQEQPQDADPSAQRLWYKRPADEWAQALPIGNGRLGAMLYGGLSTERLQLNENSFFAGGPYESTHPRARESLPKVRELIFAGRYAEAEKLANETLITQPAKQTAYQPLADLLLIFPGLECLRGYERQLDMSEALANTRFQIGSTQHLREVWASAADQVIVMRLSANKPRAITVDVALTAVHQRERSLSEPLTLVLTLAAAKTAEALRDAHRSVRRPPAVPDRRQLRRRRQHRRDAAAVKPWPLPALAGPALSLAQGPCQGPARTWRLRAAGGAPLALSWQQGLPPRVRLGSAISGNMQLRWPDGLATLRLAAGEHALFERRDGRLQQLGISR